MLKQLARGLSAGLVAAVMIAVAAGVVLVAAAFAVYAALKAIVIPATASAVTALVFAVVAGLIAVVSPQIIRGKATLKSKAGFDPASLAPAAEVAFAVIGVVGDLALSRRIKRQEKALKLKHRRR